MSIFFRSRSGGPISNKESFKSSRTSLTGMELGPEDVDTPGGGHDLPVHPRLWLFLGLLYVVLGVTQLALAASWRWWFGCAVGLGVVKTGSSLAGLGYTGGQHVRPHATTLAGRLLRGVLRVLLWGSAKVQQLLWRVRWVIYAKGLLVAMMIAIHLASPDPRPAPASFPLDCPRGKRFGCSHVAEGRVHGARGVRPLYLESGVEFVQQAAETWVAMQTHARVLTSGPGFFHARFVTFFWGFADDFFVSIRCHNSTHAVVEAQGQLRLGTSDLGVNKRRIKRFLAALAQDAATGVLPEGRCSDAAAAAAAKASEGWQQPGQQQSGQQQQQAQQKQQPAQQPPQQPQAQQPAQQPPQTTQQQQAQQPPPPQQQQPGAKAGGGQ